MPAKSDHRVRARSGAQPGGNAAVDVLVVGGGHNGLVCAAYLAATGLKVTVLERRHVVGGAAVTEEFHPGFRNSVASYTVSLLNPKVARDLELEKHGLKIVERPDGNFYPVDETRALQLRYDGAGKIEAIRAFSVHDAERYPAYDAALTRAADVLRDLVLETPPNAGGGVLELLRGNLDNYLYADRGHDHTLDARAGGGDA